MTLRLVLADDHALVRKGIRCLLERCADLQVVGEAATGPEVLQVVAACHPDVALINISMPELNGLETTRRLTRDHPRTRVVVCSIHADEEYVRQAFAAGAKAYVTKGVEPEELELAIRAVARGEAWISPSVSTWVVSALGRGEAPRGAIELLTARQREILQLIAEGRSAKEIANQLGLSIKTVESHKAQLMKRLGVRGLAGLVRSAIQLGIVSVTAR